jgi:hypothetical protein
MFQATGVVGDERKIGNCFTTVATFKAPPLERMNEREREAGQRKKPPQDKRTALRGAAVGEKAAAWPDV